MAKPKILELLRAEKERAETQLAQEQHKLQRLENFPFGTRLYYAVRISQNPPFAP